MCTVVLQREGHAFYAMWQLCGQGVCVLARNFVWQPGWMLARNTVGCSEGRAAFLRDGYFSRQGIFWSCGTVVSQVEGMFSVRRTKHPRRAAAAVQRARPTNY